MSVISPIPTVENNQALMEFEGWSEYELSSLSTINRATIHPTRFACSLTMGAMGITRDVETLLERMHLGGWEKMKYATHDIPTKHFLATVRFVDNGHATRGHIVFAVGPNRYSISFDDFCELYGFPPAEYEDTYPFRQESLVWRNIAINEPYSTVDSRAYKVKNPTIRYVLRIIANTFYARQSPKVPTSNELKLLYMGIKDSLQDAQGQPMERDYDYYGWQVAPMFFRHLLRTTSRITNVANPKIHIGGMLTPLFARVGVDLSLYPPLPEIPTMDLHYLMNNNIIAGRFVPDHVIYRFVDDDGEHLCCYLPQGHYSNTLSNRDLRFHLPRRLTWEPPSLDPPRDSY